MKAVVFEQFGGPEVLQYIDVPVPVPGPGQVLVKTRSVGVCKADWRVRTGRSQWLTCPFPVTIGYEMAGTIAGLGPGVSGFELGQPVHVLHMAVYGTYAEYMAVTADDVAPMPQSLDFDAAAAAFNYFVAWGLLNQIVHGAPGQALYIGGAAGGVGTAVIQLAQHKGMRVIASASTEAKCDYLRSLGVDKVFNYKTENDVDAVRRLTGAEESIMSTTRWQAPASVGSSTCWRRMGKSSSTTTWAATPRTGTSSTSCRAAAKAATELGTSPSMCTTPTLPVSGRSRKRCSPSSPPGRSGRPSTRCSHLPRRAEPTR